MARLFHRVFDKNETFPKKEWSLKYRTRWNQLKVGRDNLNTPKLD